MPQICDNAPDITTYNVTLPAVAARPAAPTTETIAFVVLNAASWGTIFSMSWGWVRVRVEAVDVGLELKIEKSSVMFSLSS